MLTNNALAARQYTKTLWRKTRRWMKKRAFMTALVLPTVLAFIYFLLLASPMYVSHASFAIRSADACSRSSTGKPWFPERVAWSKRCSTPQTDWETSHSG